MSALTTTNGVETRSRRSRARSLAVSRRGSSAARATATKRVASRSRNRSCSRRIWRDNSMRSAANGPGRTIFRYLSSTRSTPAPSRAPRLAFRAAARHARSARCRRRWRRRYDAPRSRTGYPVARRSPEGEIDDLGQPAAIIVPISARPSASASACNEASRRRRLAASAAGGSSSRTGGWTERPPRAVAHPRPGPQASPSE